MATIKKAVANKQTPAASTPVAVDKKQKDPINKRIVNVQLKRVRQDTQSWRDAIDEAERAFFPFRYKMQRIYIDTELNGHVQACIEKRKKLTLLRKWQFINADGVEDENTKNIFCEVITTKSVTTVDGKPVTKYVEKLMMKQWFINFISHALDAIFYGYSLINMGDVENGNFINLDVVKRWNISPDRLAVMSFPYNPHGINFLDPQYKPWYIWIDTPNSTGASTCGYGLFYNIAIYEIMLRNVFGFNGDYVELFSQPYRIGETTKVDDERTQFENAIMGMGSSGWMVKDQGDKVEFLETNSAGTGWKGYESLEQRCEKRISKMVLGHADALDSTPGKLGSSDGEQSPAGNALRDTQTADGDWITSIVNGILLPAMREIGFIIGPEVKGQMVNDNEVMENANAVADMAVKIKNAGLQIDPEYFTSQTSIPVTLPAAKPSPGAMPAADPAADDTGADAMDKKAGDNTGNDTKTKAQKKQLSTEVKNRLNKLYA
jgi:hypothetical protein